MQPVPLHMKLRCTGMEILIIINLCPNTQRTPANKFYNKTIIQELKAFSFAGLTPTFAEALADRSPPRRKPENKKLGKTDISMLLAS